MTRRAKRWSIAVALLAALVGAAVYVFEWNMLRGPVARRVELATGRPFAIHGDLDVRLGRMPRITVDGLVLGNAAWAKEPTMAEAGRAEFTIDPLALLRGRIVLPELRVSDARVSLERNADGEANWTFGKKEEGEPPYIGSLTLDRAHIGFRDPTLKTDVTLDATSQADGLLEVTGRGLVKGLKATVDGTLGSVLALTSADKPYPIKVRATLGATRASLDGALIDPLRLKGEDVAFVLEGSDMAQLFTILGVPLPPTPPYRLSGHLNHAGQQWTFRKFSGRVGSSDLSGDFSVDRGRKPQLITADLTSRKLDMADLGGFIGADRGAKSSPKPPPPGRVLPQEPFSLEKLRVADADVKFRGERVITEKLPLEKMTATLKLRDGVLSLEPLNFGVAGGNVVSTIRMDARQPAIRTHADVGVREVRLEKLFPGFKLSQANAGLLTGRAKLDTRGNSIAHMLADADGEAALMMEGGSVSELMVRLTDLDLANAVALLLTRDRQVPVRCMVVHLKGKDGRFAAEPLLLDTGKAVINGSGHVDFASESLDLQLRSRSKGFSLAALQGPIHVGGTFAKPSVRPDVPRAIGRGAAAAVLGVATGGFGLLLPLLDFGGAKDSDCAALISEAKS